MQTSVNFSLASTNRVDIRKELITEFLNELAGNGKGPNASTYYYYVETLQDGKRIYLRRPGRLNKGFDFEVNVENTNFGTNRRTTMPSHQNIYDDLALKKAEDQQEFDKMVIIIKEMYNCQAVSDIEMRGLNFTVGYSAEAILKVIKWLFIEQDITYWNWSGRNMLYNSLSNLW